LIIPKLADGRLVDGGSVVRWGVDPTCGAINGAAVVHFNLFTVKRLKNGPFTFL
jgi:hypothetical protein